MKLLQSFLIETNAKVGVRSLKQLIKMPEFYKKHGRLADKLKKKMINGSFDSELAFNSYVNLVERFADGYPKEVIEEVAIELYESEEIEISEETDEEVKLKDIIKEVFPDMEITTQDDSGTAVATIMFDGIDTIDKEFNAVYDAINDKMDDANLRVYVSSEGLGFSLFSIDDNDNEDKYADTDLYGDYPSSAAANRIIAILNNDKKIKNILSKIEENENE